MMYNETRDLGNNNVIHLKSRFALTWKKIEWVITRISNKIS